MTRRPLCGLRAALAALALAAGVVQAQPAATPLADARAATERRDWPAALAAYEIALQLRPDDADLLIEAARVHGWADRNADAARLYRRVLEVAPQRRADVLPSLAWQLLWSGDAAAAAPLFDERARVSTSGRAEVLDGLGQARQALGDQAGALAAYREALALAPADARLRRRVALSLLWNGEEDAAVAELEGLVSAHPGDRDLAWSLANARNFAGQHRQALRDFARWPEPTHPGERLDLARAWRWAGFEERAAPLLAGATAADAAWLRDWRVRRELAPYGYATVERSEDRDRLVTNARVVGAGWHPAAGMAVELQGRRLALDDDAGHPRAEQLQASVGWRLGDALSPFGTWWPTLGLRISRFDHWHPVTPYVRLRGLPADRWRVDAEAVRELVEAPRAVAQRVSVDVLALGVEHRAAQGWLWAAGAAALRFDDGTSRLRGSGRIERRLPWLPGLRAGVEAMAFERTQGGDVDRGYWNPRRYAEARAYLAWSREFRPFDIEARAGVGRSREVDGSGSESRGRPDLWELGLGWDLAPELRLRLVAGGAGAGGGISGGGAGYWRRYVNLSANLWW